MEIELASKLFILEDYTCKENMEEHIKEYIRKLKFDYPNSIVTREFYKGNNILVRATQINNIKSYKKNEKELDEFEKEEVRIKERGINGLGENVYTGRTHRKSKEKELHHGGNERERGGR